MTLGDVHVNRDGTIRFNGEAIGTVVKTGQSVTRWRAMIGRYSPLQKASDWPPYRVAYGRTRKGAVAASLADIGMPS